MRRYVIIALLNLLLVTPIFAPPNCELLKDDKDCYRACQEAYNAIRFRQGSRRSQSHFDKSIRFCPDFAYSYMEKAVPFLKRGDFITWKTLIDKAVELDPLEHLGYRGWCRLQFLRDYEGAIADIERLRELAGYDIGYCQTGDYHLIFALALCYKELGYPLKAKELMESKIQEEGYFLGPYDYYHLGVLAYDLGEYQSAIAYLERQIKENDYLAETYYWLGLAHKQLGDLGICREYLVKAEEHYQKGNYLTDMYSEPIDKIYLSDIEEELLNLQGVSLQTD